MEKHTDKPEPKGLVHCSFCSTSSDEHLLFW